MKIIAQYLLLYLVAAVLISCSSGKNMYERGDYYGAVVQAADRLKKNPDHKKSRETIRGAYPMAVSYYLDEVGNAKASNDPFKNSVVMESYLRLNELYDVIRRTPGALKVVNPQSYHNQVREYRQKAAAERYTAGEQRLVTRRREDAIEAYHHFVKANEYSRGYLDVDAKIEEALYFATLKVLVEQVPLPTVNFQLSVEFFQDQVREFLFHYTENRFVRFVDKLDKDMEPDQIIQLRFDDFMVGNTNNFSSTRELSRDSVVVGQVAMQDGKKQNVYGTVKAKFTENRQEILSSGLLTLRILDASTRKVLAHEKLPGEFVWISRWANFQGDERALTKEEMDLTKLKPLPPPGPQNMFVEFCRPIMAQLQMKVRGYYSNI
jgi:hypothetical protein